MKKIILFTTILLTGCGTPYVKYRFSDTNAVVIKPNGQQESASWHPVVAYPEIKNQINNGQCASVSTPTVIWNDGTRLNPHLIKVCSMHNDYYVNKPLQRISSEPVTPQVTLPQVTLPSSSIQQNSSNIDNAKKKCSDLGLKTGTESFGKCVLQLSK